MMSTKQNPRILSALATYRPGNEATGPVQSLRAFAKTLQEDFEIRVIANAHDESAQKKWQSDNFLPYFHLPRGRFGARGLLTLLRETPHDLLMLNSFHDPQFVIPILLWRKFGLIPRKPTILSPRGELARGALSLKARKKRIYRWSVCLARLTQDVWLHATAEHERHDIEAAGLPCRGILLAPNPRLLPDFPETPSRTASGTLRIVFLGRVAPVKNLDFALDALARVSVPVVFNIYGPMVDPDYWARLQLRIARMPDHVSVTAQGALPHNRVAATMAAHDLFFLPTMGENFGHAINEALSVGLPVLISDTTPWRGLQAATAGWDLPLTQPDLFVNAIEKMAYANTQTRDKMRLAARKFAEDNFFTSDAVAANRRMLHRVLEEDTSGLDGKRAK